MSGDAVGNPLQLWERARRYRLNEDVDLSTASEADGEGVVGRDAVTLQRRSSGPGHLGGQFVHRCLDAAAGHRPGDGPVGTDDHRGTGRTGCGPDHADHGRDARGGTRAPYRHQLVEHITHCAHPSFAGSPVGV
jgi:hypothetical protein